MRKPTLNERFGRCERLASLGSSHASVIGLTAQRWLNIDTERRFVLDGAPSYGIKTGWEDLLLCDTDRPVAVVEVEGTQPLKKFQCIANYFQSSRPELASLEFGVLLLYAYEAKGAKTNRCYPSPERPEVVALIQEVTATYRQPLLMVTVEKQFERITYGIRATSGYYHGTTCRVQAMCFEKGIETDRRTLFAA